MYWGCAGRRHGIEERHFTEWSLNLDHLNTGQSGSKPEWNMVLNTIYVILGEKRPHRNITLQRMAFLRIQQRSVKI